MDQLFLTITLSTTAGMTAGDILLLENVTPPTGSGYAASDFDDKKFMITEVVNATSVTITMGSLQMQPLRTETFQLNGITQ